MSFHRKRELGLAGRWAYSRKTALREDSPRMAASMPRDLYWQLTEYAKTNRLPVAAVMRAALRMFFEQQGRL